MQSSLILSKHLIENNDEPLTVHLSTIWFRHTKKLTYVSNVCQLQRPLLAAFKVLPPSLGQHCFEGARYEMCNFQCNLIEHFDVVKQCALLSWNVRYSKSTNAEQFMLYSVHTSLRCLSTMSQSLLSVHFVICFVCMGRAGPMLRLSQTRYIDFTLQHYLVALCPAL